MLRIPAQAGCSKCTAASNPLPASANGSVRSERCTVMFGCARLNAGRRRDKPAQREGGRYGNVQACSILWLAHQVLAVPVQAVQRLADLGGVSLAIGQQADAIADPLK